VDLPTYTNIWRIEKRLYKLYDFRLPMPLPINWIAVFIGITLPYVVLLIAIGLPFNHTLLWLYVLPPGVLTWATTRPVLEQKRLPELVESQVRYLTEPRTWVRLTPLAEKDRMVLSARVWRGRQASERAAAAMAAAAAASASAAASRAAGGAARGTGARRGRAKARVPAVALNAAPVPVRDHGRPAGRMPRPANGQVLTPGSAIRPRVLALGPGGGSQPTPALPLSRPVPRSTASQPSPARPPVIPAVIEGVPVRARDGAGGAPLLEVSHDRPGPRSGPAEPPAPPTAAHPVTTLPAGNAGTTWPSPARPLRPVRTAPAPPEPSRAETALVQAAPVQAAPVEPAPTESAPVESAPVEPASVESAPTEATAVEAAPIEIAPDGIAPVEAAPEQSAPAEPALVEAAPELTAVTEPAPAESAPAEPAPAEPASELTSVTEPETVEQASAEPAPVAPAPPQPAPVEVASAVAPPAHTAPAESTPRLPEVPAEAHAPASQSRLEHSHEPAQATIAAAVQETQNRAVPSIERALSGPAREQNPSWHGKVKIVTGAGASHGPGARDQEALDRNRARLDVPEPRRILVLGATSGAGQTVTALTTGYMLASLREHPVAVVDLHDGTLARYRAPAAWLDEILAGRPPQQVTSSRPDGLNPTPKPSPARLDVIASHQQPRDGDEIKLAVQLNRHYPLTVLDPGPGFLTRLLKVTDQLVVVVPANAEAEGALADTRDWLDNNGHAELAMQSVTVINGVSRRSLPDVEHAESIARGRSRAIVRIPWDDMLPVAAAGPSTLRPQTRVAYTALAGVLVAGLATAAVRKKQ
jgi:MinD-like ATPase involved in chromosome partitioning or flagellar assembly